MRASDIEFGLPTPSYTVDTLTYLKEKYPKHEFSVIMGSDSLQNLHKWKNSEVILKNYHIYVYLRPAAELMKPSEKNIHLLKAPLLEISATQIRDIVKSGKSIRYMVPEKVMEEIEKCGYYRD